VIFREKLDLDLRVLTCESSCRFTSSSLFSAVIMSRSIFKMITAKILTSDHLTNILYVAVSIIAMFIESDVDLELTLNETASRDFDCSISLTDFSLN